MDATAAIIAASVGPSGSNTEYLSNLVASLKDNEVLDDYTEALEARVRALVGPE